MHCSILFRLPSGLIAPISAAQAKKSDGDIRAVQARIQVLNFLVIDHFCKDPQTAETDKAIAETQQV